VEVPVRLRFPKKVPRDRDKNPSRDAKVDRATLRAFVIARARGRCENRRCRADLVLTGCVMDHWLGGSGRRSQQEKMETVWMLCLRCNQERTDNRPSAAYWNKVHAEHCKEYGYLFIPHKELHRGEGDD
jgi:hypothetical protein